MTHTSTPRKRKTVKKRRLSVELWLHGQQLHRMQGAEPQRQDACGEGGAAPYSLPPLLPPSARHPPGAHCLPPGQYLQTYLEPPVPRCGGIRIPQMSHHLTLKPKGEAKETKAGRGWVAQGHTASKQQNAGSNLDLSSGVTVASQRES